MKKSEHIYIHVIRSADLPAAPDPKKCRHMWRAVPGMDMDICDRCADVRTPLSRARDVLRREMLKEEPNKKIIERQKEIITKYAAKIQKDTFI